MLESEQKDWHPNSNEQVLNLVHPSLYPLVYGQTRVLSGAGDGRTHLPNFMDLFGKGQPGESNQPISPRRAGRGYYGSFDNEGLWSQKFQWLPCDVEFQGKSGTDVKITSYINNLHPKKHSNLYSIIEKFIAKAIPMWNEVLVVGEYEGRTMRISCVGAEFDPEFPDYAMANMSPEIRKKVEEFLRLPNNPNWTPDSDDSEDDLEPPKNWWEDEDWGVYRTLEWKWRRCRRVLHPEPDLESYEHWKKYDPNPYVENGPGMYPVKLEERFRERGLQIIVKLSSIELTPDKPSEYIITKLFPLRATF
jgi:hypothetical protein